MKLALTYGGLILRRSLALACLVLLAAALGVACRAEKPGLTESSLRNATYVLPGQATIELRDGHFQSPPGPPGQVASASLVSYALGELNGDGARDAAVVLAWSGGGSGTFYVLIAVLNADGAAKQTAIQELGDRIRLNSLAIKDRNIFLDLITQGPDDPMCCPTLAKKLSYRLKNDALEGPSTP